jgi:hypothetical protein
MGVGGIQILLLSYNVSYMCMTVTPNTGKPKYMERKPLSHCHFVHHNPTRNAFEMKTGHHGKKLVNNCLTYSMFHYYHSQDLATSPLNAMGSSLKLQSVKI